MDIAITAHRQPALGALSKRAVRKVLLPAANAAISRIGYRIAISRNPDRILIARDPTWPALFPDVEEEFWSVQRACKAYTMTTIERQYTLWKAVQHIVRANIPGAFVESGVWKGGSSMIAARTLLSLNASSRDLYLYDTFTGWPQPSAVDRNVNGELSPPEEVNRWVTGSLSEVRTNLLSTGYPSERLHLVAGKVEETIPGTMPEQIALLRLDTDWYQSTRHELTHLYPRLAPGGVLIVDDYGYWSGCRRAVDEYFAGLEHPILLNRIDSDCRMGVRVL